MIRELINYLFNLRERQQIIIAISKGGVMMSARNINLIQSVIWEFSGFSQNGEDGIIDVLRRQLKTANRYFIEIGASDETENNSSWLLIAEKYNGLMGEGDSRLVARARRMVQMFSIGSEYINMFVTLDSVKELKQMAFHSDPDAFSLNTHHRIQRGNNRLACFLSRHGLSILPGEPFGRGETI